VIVTLPGHGKLVVTIILCVALSVSPRETAISPQPLLKVPHLISARHSSAPSDLVGDEHEVRVRDGAIVSKRADNHALVKGSWDFLHETDAIIAAPALSPPFGGKLAGMRTSAPRTA
jgi:hypothetical protein